MKPALTALSPVAVLFVGSLSAIPPAAAADPFDGNWHFSVSPYAWLPNVNGTLSHELPPRLAEVLETDARRLSAEVGPNDYLSNLKFVMMLSADVRKGPWSAVTDLIYLDMGNQGSNIRSLDGRRGRDLGALSREADTNLSATVWTLVGGYTVAHGDWGHVDLLAGLRYLGMDTELKWQLSGSHDLLDSSGKISKNREEWDGILGVRGQVLFAGTNWFMPYYLDVGTGSSNWTWQALLGAGYRFDWGEATLALRSLSYEFDEHDADIRFTGPALGVTFRW